MAPSAQISEIKSRNSNSKLDLHNVGFLRFICALIVFLGHTTDFLNIQSISTLGVTKNHSPITSAGQLIFCGPAAVMMFFVISGLCIHAPNVDRLSLNILDFYTRRFVRIGIPLVFAYIIKIFLIGGLSFYPLPVWSLWCEMIYYLIYPFLMLIIFRFGFFMTFSFSLICAVALASTRDIHQGMPWMYGPLLSWILFLPVWLLGVFIARNLQKTKYLPTIFRANIVIFLGAGALFALGILTTLLEFHLNRFITFKWSLIAFGLPSAAFIFVVLGKNCTNSGIMQFLEKQGEWSYSLYLIHPIGVTLALDALVFLDIKHFGQALSLFIMGFVLLAGALTSLLFFYICERPSHLLAKKLGPKVALLSAAQMKFQAADSYRT